MLIGRKLMGVLILTFTVLTMSGGIVLFFKDAMLFIEIFSLSMVLTMCVFAMKIGFKLLIYESERQISIEEIRKRVKKQTERHQRNY